MSSILLNLAQDPAAIMECLAAAGTAAYIVRLSLQNEVLPQTSDPFEKLVDPRLSFPQSAFRKKSEDLRAKFLRIFAVGETILVAKRSLRKQRCRS